MIWWVAAVALTYFYPWAGVPFLILVALGTIGVWLAQKQGIEPNAAFLKPPDDPSAQPAPKRATARPASTITAYDLARAYESGNIIMAATHYPLTIEGASRDVVARIDTLLSPPSPIRPREWKAEIALLYSRHNFHCKEVESFLSDLRSQFEREKAAALSKVDMSKFNDKERASAIAEAEDDAIERLQSSLCLRWEDLGVLMRDRPADMGVDDQIAAAVDGDAELLDTYMWLLAGNGVIQVQDSGLRARLNALQARGLVRNGRDIPLERLTDRVSLAILNEAVADVAPKRFTKKADAIAFLMQQPDAQSRIRDMLPWRDLYEVIPPSGVDTQAAVAAYRYAIEYASLIVTTAVTTRRAMETKAEAEEDGHKIQVLVDDTECKICRPHDGKTVTVRSLHRLPPHHVGCTCMCEVDYG